LAARSSSQPSPSHGEGTGPAGSEAKSSGRAPGLREQVGRTRSAFVGLVAAHVKLARLEFEEIGGALKTAAALGGCALLLILLGSTIFSVGLFLWIGEWAFGSIGWGGLLGMELCVAIGVVVLLGLMGLGWSRTGLALVLAVAFAVVALPVAYQSWKQIPLGLSITGWPEEAQRTVWAVLDVVWGVAIFTILFGVLTVRWRDWDITRDSMYTGAIVGACVGILSVTHSVVAIAIAVGLCAWPIWAGILLAGHGVDMDKLKARYLPNQTIDTTKETIEWMREQLPLGPR
jgi:uncharacterized membrane protein YqjE